MIMQTIYLHKYAIKSRVIINLKFRDKSFTAKKSKETRNKILAQENTKVLAHNIYNSYDQAKSRG